jgi:ribosomal protein L34E
MACRVNWPRFYTRQRTLIRKLASDCNCDSCKKRLKAMKGTDKIMKANDENRTPNRPEKT